MSPNKNHSDDLLALFNKLTSHRTTWPLGPLRDGRIPYGQQHNTLVSIAGTLRARGICDHAIENCLQAINQYQCERPGSRANISRIVQSTRRWGAR